MIKVQDILDNLKTFLSYFFGSEVPPHIPPAAWIVCKIFVTIIVLLFVLRVFLSLVTQIIDTWQQKFRPLFYNEEEKRRGERRQIFATHLAHEVRQLGIQEDWYDYRFTELEAEIEADGRRKVFGLIAYPLLKQNRFRREKSLSRALRSSADKLILLEGGPGAGKSVALRHVAQELAERTSKVRSIKSIIPIY